MTFTSHSASCEKLRISIRYWLIGRGFHNALDAMEFAAGHHTGLRKDGTPEFSHQVWQAHYVRTLDRLLIDPEGTLATVFLHDVVEDHPVTLSEIESLFGEAIAISVDRISKVVEGMAKDTGELFAEMAQDPRSSIAKGVDRIHNHASMKGVFSRLKQLRYLDETEEDILPMLKLARRRFHRQESAYENIKHSLMSQIELYRHVQEEAA